MEKALETLRSKVARLSVPATFEISRTMVRSAARDGLMEDGKEDLLKSKLMCFRDRLVLTICARRTNQIWM